MKLTYPREVGPPRKVVFNEEEYKRFVNLYNGKKKAIYYSIYSFDTINGYKPEYNSAVISCLFFDFDDKDCNAYEEVKKLHTFCVKKNIKHRLIMSGGGYHCYVITNNYRTTNTRDTIYNAQHFFIHQLNLELDTHVIGNPAQLARVPNTWNGKRGRFCIPLTKNQFESGDKSIKELSCKQNFVDNLIGEKEFDIKEYDYCNTNLFEEDELNNIDLELKEININFPPCLVNIIKKQNMRWKERYLLILYLKEIGYSKSNAIKILNELCNDSKFHHCINEEKQLQYLYSRDDLLFPSCDKIKLDGYCVGKCKQHDKVVYK